MGRPQASSPCIHKSHRKCQHLESCTAHRTRSRKESAAWASACICFLEVPNQGYRQLEKTCDSRGWSRIESRHQLEYTYRRIRTIACPRQPGIQTVGP